MISQLSDPDIIDFSEEITKDITIGNPLFTEDTEPPPEPNATISKESARTTAEKDKKSKSEEIFVNLHPSNIIKHESAIMRKIEHGSEIIFKNKKYTTPVTKK